jgi:DNA repair protein RAD51
LLCFVV